MQNIEMHRSTERVLSILEYASKSDSIGFTLKEISQVLDAPKSSLYPILQTLSQMGFISYSTSDFRYKIGYKSFEVGSSYLRNGGINNDISTQLKEISGSCGESCHFGELIGGDVLYLFKEDSIHSIRMFSSPGRKIPAYATAIGKALLSEKTLEELISLYSNTLEVLTPNTITSFEKLCSQLTEIRTSGFAYEVEESTPLIRCVAVPVYKGNEIIGAFSVAIPVFRYAKEKEEEIKLLLQKARSTIEQRIAGI
ncbi:MAG: IclR family transcriptional regulator [Oscillospiraceae bacterium]